MKTVPLNEAPLNSSFFSQQNLAKPNYLIQNLALMMVQNTKTTGIRSMREISLCYISRRRKQKCLSAYPSAGQDRTYKFSYDQPADTERAAESVTSYTTRRVTVQDQDKLLFLQEDIQRFDLQDLLRASAEVLGSGCFGASYKAGISSGKTLVVKRYKHMNNVGRDEFHEHIRRLGKLSHPNLLPLVAYYYRREEKLLIAEFMPNRSLASHLHGVAKGLGYLFKELPTLTIPHGHLKSSNVVLNKAFEPLLTDYALRPVMNSDQSHNLMIAYKSPEYSLKGHITKKTDVWCLGVLILELITGRFPENYLSKGYDANMSLVTWVSEMVKEKKTSDVFDKEMIGKKNCKAEMLRLLKIGLSCCEEDEERRMEMRDAVEKIERLRESSDTDFEASTNVFASRLIEDDDFGFAVNR
ncbi:hypothetical protein Bca4012_090224 [Brassica carinata]